MSPVNPAGRRSRAPGTAPPLRPGPAPRPCAPVRVPPQEAACVAPPPAWSWPPSERTRSREEPRHRAAGTEHRPGTRHSRTRSGRSREKPRRPTARLETGSHQGVARARIPRPGHAVTSGFLPRPAAAGSSRDTVPGSSSLWRDRAHESPPRGSMLRSTRRRAARTAQSARRVCVGSAGALPRRGRIGPPTGQDTVGSAFRYDARHMNGGLVELKVRCHGRGRHR